MRTFLLEIVSPERVTFREQVEFLAAPAYDGELGVLPGHTHLLAQLVPGTLRFRKEGETEFVAISGGFLEVHPDRTAVFAETAELAQEIDVERANLAAEAARFLLESKPKDADLAAAQASLRRALVRLRAASEIRRRARL